MDKMRVFALIIIKIKLIRIEFLKNLLLLSVSPIIFKSATKKFSTKR